LAQFIPRSTAWPERGWSLRNWAIRLRSLGDFALYAHAVRIVIQAQHRQQNQVFEFSKDLALRHKFYIIEK
jgi:hypothetical protein